MHSALIWLHLVPEVTSLKLAGVLLLWSVDRSKDPALEPGEAAGAMLNQQQGSVLALLQ